MTVATDDFNRANAANLGANWGSVDSGVSIAGNVVQGPNGLLGGSIRTAESFTDDQFASVEVVSVSVTQWIGPAVRMSSTGSATYYTGIYWYDGGGGGVYRLHLYKNLGGSYTLLANVDLAGALAAGTVLRLEVIGDELFFYVGGDLYLYAVDSAISTGAPGLAIYSAASLDNWSGGDLAVTFPTTPVIDNFNRAGGSSAAGTTASDGIHVWSSGTINGDVDGGHIVSNAYQTVAGATDLYVTADFGPDCEAYYDLPDAPPSSEYAFLAARVQDEGSSTWDGYGLIWIAGTGWQIRKYTNGSGSALGATVAGGPLADGDSIGLDVVGDVITAYRKKSGGVWNHVLTRTDATYAGAGVIGFELSNGTLDNFGGGTIPVPGGARPTSRALVIA